MTVQMPVAPLGFLQLLLCLGADCLDEEGNEIDGEIQEREPQHEFLSVRVLQERPARRGPEEKRHAGERQQGDRTAVPEP